MEAVSLGHHLNPPEGCPEVIKSLMLSCWELRPGDRIKFLDILKTLSKNNLETHRAYSNSHYIESQPIRYTDTLTKSLIK